MKKITFLLASIVLIFANGCQDESNFDSSARDEFYKFIQFKDLDEFITTAKSLEGKNPESLRDWEKKQEFVSLKTIYEQAVEEEENFLYLMVEKYGENSNVTRADFGYSPLTQKYLDNKYIFIDSYGVIDMNISIPLYSYVVNPDGIVKIGHEIFQFKYDIIRRITDGNENRIQSLAHYIQTDSSHNIIVEQVQRNHEIISDSEFEGARTQANTSCESTNDGYRTIAYEERVGRYSPAWCGATQGINWFVRVRSLKKILGTWQNHKTNYMTVVSNNVKMGHYWVDDDEFPDMSTATLVNMFADEVNVSHGLPYGHTAEHYYILNYPFDCFRPDDPNAASVVYSPVSDITVKGKASTQCAVGATYATYPWADRPIPN